MREMVRVCVPRDATLYQARLEILAGGFCSGILPASLQKHGGRLQIWYAAAGYRRLAGLPLDDAAAGLQVLKCVLKMQRACRAYLFFPEEYVLSPHTVYLAKDGREARLAYVPAARQQEGRNSMADFLLALKRKSSESDRAYFDAAREILAREDLRESQTLALLDELQTEARICAGQGVFR